MTAQSRKPRRCRTCEQKLRAAGVPVCTVMPLSPDRQAARTRARQRLALCRVCPNWRGDADACTLWSHSGSAFRGYMLTNQASCLDPNQPRW